MASVIEKYGVCPRCAKPFEARGYCHRLDDLPANTSSAFSKCARRSLGLVIAITQPFKWMVRHVPQIAITRSFLLAFRHQSGCKTRVPSYSSGSLSRCIQLTARARNHDTDIRNGVFRDRSALTAARYYKKAEKYKD